MTSTSLTKYCIVSKCNSRSPVSPDLAFFSLPKDAHRRQQWLLLAGREDLLRRPNLNHKSYCICSIHFDSSTVKTVRHLKDGVLPSLRLPNQSPPASTRSDNSEDELSENTASTKTRLHNSSKVRTQTRKDLSNKETQTTADLSNENERKRKLKRRGPKSKRIRIEAVTQIEKELQSKSASLNSDTEDNIIRGLRILFEWQNKIESKFESSQAEYKIFCLNLYYSSPHAYQCLHTTLTLPSKNTLAKFKMNIGAKLEDRVLDSLSFKIKSLPDEAKYCTICLDKIELKSSLYYDITKDDVIGLCNINGRISPTVACNAHVIMLQGIFLDWNQPIAYSFLKNVVPYAELDTWIDYVIRKLFDIGIVVKAIVSKQNSDSENFAKVKQVTVDEPYFVVDDRKIYYIFDVPHMVCSIRDSLLLSDFFLEGNRISWEYIKTLFEYQKEKNFTLMPKITMAHLKPNIIQSRKVKYAAQIFSSTVSAALETYIDFERITEEARATANFLKIMDALFDILNSSDEKSDKKLRSSFRLTPALLNVLEEVHNMFAKLDSGLADTSICQNSKAPKTFQNFQLTIQSIVLLFKDLNLNRSQPLFTRNLNRDCMVAFYRQIKKEAGCLKPTPIKFTRAFSKLFTWYMLKTVPSTKSDTDVFQVLKNAEEINSKIAASSEVSKPSLVCLNGDTDYRLHVPNDHSMTLVASFLLLKCSEKHSNCAKLTSALESAPRLLNDRLMIYYSRYFKDPKMPVRLLKASPEFEQCIQTLDRVFTQNFHIRRSSY